MKTVGLVTEYNPFHNGHLYHLKNSLKVTNSNYSIIAMSGNFLQRGEIAILDKWTRAKIAVECGADLVLEIPNIFCSQSAEFFALGSILVLNSINIVDSICFGSELGDSNSILQFAKFLNNEPIEFKNSIKCLLKQGLSYPTAREKALSKYFNNIDILKSPNNILGIEYCKSILKLNSKMKPYTINRFNSNFHDLELNGNICSASAIRNHLLNKENLNDLKNFLPSTSFNSLKNQNFVFNDSLFEYFKFIIFRSFNELNDIQEVNEGIENRIFQSLLKSNSYEAFLINLKNKRWPMNRIKRMFINILLDIKKDDLNFCKSLKTLPYIQILAFNDNGRKLLKKIKKTTNSKLLSDSKFFKATNKFEQILIDTDLKANHLFSLAKKESFNCQFKKFPKFIQ